MRILIQVNTNNLLCTVHKIFKNKSSIYDLWRDIDTLFINMKFKVDDVTPLRTKYLGYTKENYDHAWSSCKYSYHSNEKYTLEQSSKLPKNAIRIDFSRKNLFVESCLMSFMTIICFINDIYDSIWTLLYTYTCVRLLFPKQLVW